MPASAAQSGAFERFLRSPWAVRLSILALCLVIFSVIYRALNITNELGWQAESLKIAKIAEEGRYEEAAQAMIAFGKKYEGALRTHDFHFRTGTYFAKAGKWSIAAGHFRNALRVDPKRADTAAAAGEALWQSGDRAGAIVLFAQELKDGNKANDLAKLRLGQYALDAKNYREAFRFFESIRDREKYKAELDAAHKLAEAAVLEPARLAAN